MHWAKKPFHVSQRRQHDRGLKAIEQLETRNLLAGDLVANFLADGLNSSYEDGQVVESWTDEVSGIAASQIGSPVLVKGALSGRSVLRFNATDGDDGFRVKDSDSPISGAGDFSVSVAFMTSTTQVGSSGNWFENTGLVDANRLSFGKDWGLSINSSGQLSAGLGVALFTPSTTLMSAESNLNDGNLHFATLTRSAGNLSIYVDGNAAATTNGADAAPRDAIDLVIGSLQSGGAGKGFTGDIAEVRLFNGALSGAEVSSLHSELESFYVNTAPVAVNDSYTYDEDPLFGFNIQPAATGVLANDTDTESNTLSAVLVSGPAQGTVALDADGRFLYDPPENFFGTDSFTYHAFDGQASNVATVNLTVRNVYDPAQAVADRYKTLPGQNLNIPSLVGVLANDANPDRADLQAVLVTNVSDGSLTLNSDGGFTYNSGNFAGTTTFSYRIVDGTGTSNTANVELVVNTPPVSVADTFLVAEDNTLTLAAGQGVTGNDIDAEGDNLQVTLMTDVSNGSLALNADGSLSYTPNENFFGSDSFTYMISDGEDASGIATATIQVSAVNDVPVTASDLFVVLSGTEITTDASKGVLKNDLDIEGQAMSVSLAVAPSNGNLTLNADGSFSYSANEGYVGIDSFSYIATDGQANSAPTEALLYVGTSPLIISEFMVANTTTETRVRDEPGGRFQGEALTPDWIEIHNPTTSPLDVAGYHLTDTENNLTKWAFPEGIVIDAGGYLVVYASRLSVSNPELDETGRIHTNFKMQPEGEYLALTSPEGGILHEFGPAYPRQRPDVSYGLNSAGEPSYFKSATLGAANTDETYLGISEDTTFSIDRGYYTEPFDVEITTTEENGQIWYTLDGSTPSPTNGTMYAAPINISGTTNLRASVFKDGYIHSLPDSQTYLFLDQVLQQSGDGIESAPWGDNGPDWEMDPEIVNNADPEIRVTTDDLKSIPTVSLVTDWDLFFGNQGIYPWDPGRNIGVARDNYEIPTSFEFFDVDGRSTQVYSTVQIVGGSSPDRNGNDWKTDKLSMRVRFTEDVGRSSLNYPVFGPSATDSFSTLVVDARLNNVWSYSGGSEPANQRGRAQYLRDSFASDMQLALGGYGAHGHHVNVYINGVYWGLHTLHERPDDNYMASYLGGDNDDYDVIKHTQSTIVSGSNESFVELTSGLGTSRDPITDEQWELAQSRLHIDEFIDYMLLNYYGANSDWDHHNWYASSNREDGKWRFHSWDAEKVINGSGVSADSALQADRTTTNNRNSPTGIHQRLITHPEYRLRFEDKVQDRFFNDGVLTPENTFALYSGRAATIDAAIRAESARWGDNQRSNPYTRQDWMNVRDDIYENYFPERTATVLSQFIRRGWFDEGLAPEFSVNGSAQHGGFAAAGSSLTISTPDGTVYFTLDGTDPRVEGGAVADSAQIYTDGITIGSSLMIKARLLTADGVWSPLSQAMYSTSAPASSANLRISEIHYHPADPTASEIAAGYNDGDEFEFIELVNISGQSIDLTSVQFEQVFEADQIRGVSFSFADSSVTELAAGRRLVVVENMEAFQARYGNAANVAGEWSGKLGNAAETIKLVAGDETIHEITYDDQWYPATDGAGSSLEVVDAAAVDLNVWTTKEGWKASSTPGGSPGLADGPVPGDSNGDGIFNSSDLVIVFQAGEYEDGIAGNSTFEEGDWNGDGDFSSRDLVFVFQIGNYVQGAVPVASISGDAAAVLHSLADGSSRDDLVMLDRSANFADEHERRRVELDAQSRDAVFEQIAAEDSTRAGDDGISLDAISQDDLEDRLLIA